MTARYISREECERKSYQSRDISALLQGDFSEIGRESDKSYLVINNPNDLIIGTEERAYHLIAERFNRNGRKTFSAKKSEKGKENELLEMSIYEIQEETIGKIEKKLGRTTIRKCDFSKSGFLNGNLISTVRNVANNSTITSN